MTEQDKYELYKGVRIKINDGYCWPKTILCYSYNGNNLQTVTRNGVFSSTYGVREAQFKVFVSLLQADAVRINSCYIGDEAEELLIEKGIRKYLKKLS